MKLHTATILNGLAVAVKLATQLLVNKMLAVTAGPAAFGVIGQFQSLIAIVTLLSNGALANGVVKYTAEYRDDPDAVRRLLGTALYLVLGLAALIAALLLAVQGHVGRWIFLGQQMPALSALAMATVPAALGGLLMAVINGNERLGAYVIASILGSLATAAWIAFHLFGRGVDGAFFALATAQAVVCVATAVVFHFALSGHWRQFAGRFDAGQARRLGHYAAMGLTSAIAVPVVQLVVRKLIADDVGLVQAGYWQALLRISETHLLLLTTTLSVYLLPRLSRMRDAPVLRKALLSSYRFVLPLVLTTALIIFFCRTPLIHLLLSERFLPVAEVLPYQLIGDVLKVGSWVLAFTMISHAMSGTYIVSEVLFAGIQIGLSYFLIGSYGLVGASFAYAATYALYWVVMVRVVQGLFRRLDAESKAQQAL